MLFWIVCTNPNENAASSIFQVRDIREKDSELDFTGDDLICILLKKATVSGKLTVVKEIVQTGKILWSLEKAIILLYENHRK